jgi:arylsulfatase
MGLQQPAASRTGEAIGENSVEHTKGNNGNSGSQSPDVKNDTPAKDERGIPGNVSAESHAYRNFAGKVGRTMVQSKPDWPSRPEAPAGAPNIVVILCDDRGAVSAVRLL